MKRVVLFFFITGGLSIPLYAGIHTVNGQFDSGEWSVNSFQPGIYSRFYYEWQDNDLYIMNDWYNTDKGFELNPDKSQWNTFIFDSGGSNWVFKVFADNTVEVTADGKPVTDSGIIAAYGFGKSIYPGIENPDPDYAHTLYEAMIPGLANPIRIRERDPRKTTDIGDGSWEDGGPDGFYTPEPATIALLAFGGIALLRRKR